MRFSLLKKRCHLVALCMAMPALAILFLVSGCYQWSPLNCWHEDVDINSGRVRHTRILLFCRIGDRTEDTWLSRTVANPNGVPNWRRVNTFSTGIHHSPHYQYHSAIQQIEMLELVEGTIAFEPDARRRVADSLTTLWRKTGSSFGADGYIQKVADIAFALHDNGFSNVKASDVPTG